MAALPSGDGERRDFDPLETSLAGGVIGALLFVVLGATAATSEYASGMIRLTFAAVPRRGRVLADKAAVVGAIALAAGTLATVAMFVCGQLLFAGYGLETASLADGDALLTVVVSAALTPVLPVLAVALGMAAQHRGCIVGILAFILVPPFLAGVLPRWWEEDVLRFHPLEATDVLVAGHLERATADLAPGVALLVLAGWVALFLGAAWAVLERRDP